MAGGARFMRGMLIGLPLSAAFWAATLIPIIRIV